MRMTNIPMMQFSPFVFTSCRVCKIVFLNTIVSNTFSLFSSLSVRVKLHTNVKPHLKSRTWPIQILTPLFRTGSNALVVLARHISTELTDLQIQAVCDAYCTCAWMCLKSLCDVHRICCIKHFYIIYVINGKMN